MLNEIYYKIRIKITSMFLIIFLPSVYLSQNEMSGKFFYNNGLISNDVSDDSFTENHKLIISDNNRNNKYEDLNYKKKLLKRWEKSTINQSNSSDNINNTEFSLIENVDCRQQSKEREIREEIDSTFNSLILKETAFFKKTHFNVFKTETSLSLAEYTTPGDYLLTFNVLNVCEKTLRSFCDLNSLVFVNHYENTHLYKDYELCLLKLSNLIGNLNNISKNRQCSHPRNLRTEVDSFFRRLDLEVLYSRLRFTYLRKNNFIKKSFRPEDWCFYFSHSQIFFYVIHEIERLKYKPVFFKSLLFLFFLQYPTDGSNGYYRRNYLSFLHRIFIVLRCSNEKMFGFETEDKLEFYIHALLDEYVEINGQKLSVSLRVRAQKRIDNQNKIGKTTPLYNHDNYYLIKLLIDSSMSLGRTFYKNVFLKDWRLDDFQEADISLRPLIYAVKMVNLISDMILARYTQDNLYFTSDIK